METSVNNKCKAFTSLEQSRKLTEILPHESVDMYYCYGMDIHTKKCDYDTVPTIIDADNQIDICDIPCWSLASLLGALPNGIVMNKDSQNGMYHFSSKYIGTSVTADNPVDACYELILKLHELNLL